MGAVPDPEQTDAWKLLANCRGVDPDLFFPEQGFAGAPIAKKICAQCEVIDECFAYGVKERYGIWGGAGERERRRLRRKAV